MPMPVIIAYAALNLIVFLMYGIDKYKAIKGRWRIPEATLLFGAVIGVFGALCGMYILRHKTRKPKFFITVPLIMIAELALFVWLFVI